MTPVTVWSSAKRSNSSQPAELEGQPRRGQLLEHQRAVRGVAGVGPGPQRARGRQRQQVGVVVEHRGEDRDDAVALGHPDVHVDAPDQHLAAPPLGAVDQLLVAVPGGQLLLGPGGEGVGAGPHEVHAEGVGAARAPPRGCRAGRRRRPGPSGQIPVTTSTVLRSSSWWSRPGSGEPRSRRREQVDRGVGQVAGVTVDEGELPLDTDRGGRRRLEVDPHGTSEAHGPRGPTPSRHGGRRSLARGAQRAQHGQTAHVRARGHRFIPYAGAHRTFLLWGDLSVIVKRTRAAAGLATAFALLAVTAPGGPAGARDLVGAGRRRRPARGGDRARPSRPARSATSRRRACRSRCPASPAATWPPPAAPW